MLSQPLVSVIMPFYDTPARFMREAIESVLGQTYENWELLLVDDGSAEESTAVARAYAEHHPGRIRYLEHDGHRHCGVTASRQLALEVSRGDILAFLDADDVWLPPKLAQQAALLEQHPAVGFLYGNTLYWYGWTGRPEDAPLDYMPPLGLEPGTVVGPPTLLPLYLRGRAAVPCTCSVIVRRKALEQVDGFQSSLAGEFQLYEDQVFYAKLCLETPVFIAGECWDRYRQHPGSSTAIAAGSGREYASRAAFLAWLASYLVAREISDKAVWRALQRQRWLLRRGAAGPYGAAQDGRMVRLVKKWLLRLEERLAPELLQEKLWPLREARSHS